MPLTAGTRIGPYEVVEAIGAGGMGLVFRARDHALARDVAVKVLPAAVTDDDDRRQRFAREARLLAALNHPHIAQVYGIEDSSAGSAIVMELVPGATLGDLIRSRAISPRQALAYGLQIALALDAAHEKGIIHRDLKPDNIKVTPDGVVKVLDFGLARGQVEDEGTTGLETRTAAFDTRPGQVMGTVGYMSPEQVRGQDVDRRTDIWAFGCILFELFSGRFPFAAPTASDTIAAVLEKEPDWTALPTPTPSSVRHLIGRCLEKDRRQRLRDIGDAIPELAGERPALAASNSATHTRSWSSLVRPLTIVLATAALVLAGYFAMSSISPGTAPSTPSSLASSSPATPLTAYPGHEHTPTLSPDGSQVAFSWNGPGQDNFDIYFKLVGAGEPRQLTSHPARDAKPAWSPNGARIAFLRFASERAAELMVIPALGGAERRIATVYPVHSWDRPISNLAWTPDGRWLAFGGALAPDGPRGIWLLTADGKESQETRQVTEVPPDSDTGDFSPVPSPDGTHVAFIRERTLGRSAIFVVPLTAGGVPAGRAAQLTPETWNVNGVAWTADGRDLLFSWGGHFGLSRLSRIPATSPPGRFANPTPLPFGDQATALSISQSGRVVYSAQFRDTALYEAPLSGSSPQPLAGSGFSSTFDEATPHYSPDGARIAFASTRSGVEEIWIANRDGSKPQQMTSFEGPQCSNPQWSPTGRSILFNSRREGSSDLYTLVPDTGEIRRLTTEPSDENEARWSRDGRWIDYGSTRTGREEVWRIQADGGDPKQITRQGGTTATESPDRRYLYYAKSFSSPSSIWRVPLDGGREEPVVEGLSYSLNFVVGDRGLYFLTVGDASHKTSIDFFEFATGSRRTIVDLQRPWWYGMALSPDGKLLFPLVNSAGSNLMLVDNFR
jgi:serine/threonine protein kinase/dipeptidyl aminopeptidase/acylaminoacyl peptidase